MKSGRAFRHQPITSSRGMTYEREGTHQIHEDESEGIIADGAYYDLERKHGVDRVLKVLRTDSS